MAVFGMILMAAILISVLFVDIFMPYDPEEPDLGNMLSPPSLIHPLGTDELGRDLLTRTLYGGRVSMNKTTFYHVYILQSAVDTGRYYTGFTEDLKTRLQSHNYGQSPHTSKYKPWNLITYPAFNEKTGALAFEKYLKSHSGKAFANK